MPSKSQLDETAVFLYTCILHSDLRTIDYEAVGEAISIKGHAARMRYSRLKQLIDTHGTSFTNSSETNTTAQAFEPSTVPPYQEPHAINFRASKDEQIRFLISCVRNSNSGKVDFNHVASDCQIVSRGAAAKRYERIIKAHGMMNPGKKAGAKKAKQQLATSKHFKQEEDESKDDEEVFRECQERALIKTERSDNNEDLDTKEEITSKLKLNRIRFITEEEDDDEVFRPNIKLEKTSSVQSHEDEPQFKNDEGVFDGHQEHGSSSLKITTEKADDKISTKVKIEKIENEDETDPATKTTRNRGPIETQIHEDLMLKTKIELTSSAIDGHQAPLIKIEPLASDPIQNDAECEERPKKRKRTCESDLPVSTMKSSVATNNIATSIPISKTIVSPPDCEMETGVSKALDAGDLPATGRPETAETKASRLGEEEL